jgi:chromate transporter
VSRKSPTYYDLFLTFFWLGMTAFGGLAMTTTIRKKIIEKNNWLDEGTFDSGLALCQLIPGAIVMQLVAYIGLKIKGKRGAVISFVGFGLPAFIIMFILSVLYTHSRNLHTIEHILGGLRILIIAIVANAALSFGRKNFRNINDVIIAALAASLFLLKLHPVIVLLASAAAGLFLTKKEIPFGEEPVKYKTFSFFIKILSGILAGLALLFILDKNLFMLALVMLRIDLFSFGGGLAATPIMYHEFVDIYQWVSEKTFMDGIVLGQATPGSIIISATFFGYLNSGIIGCLLATVSVFTPSFLILMGLIPFFDRLKTYPLFKKVINGILCSFVGLLAVITYRFGLEVNWNVVNILIVAVSFVILLFKIDVVWLVLSCVLVYLII